MKPNLIPVTDEIVKEKTELFNKHIVPNLNLIYTICIKFSHDPRAIEDNYTDVLTNFFRYIRSYDEKKNLNTWIYAVSVRHIMDLNRKLKMPSSDNVDVSQIASSELADDEPGEVFMSIENYREYYNDDILEALDRLNPIFKRALLLQMSGYNMNEITDIEYKAGNLKTRNMETVKSRIHIAKKLMRNMITRDGDAKN